MTTSGRFQIASSCAYMVVQRERLGLGGFGVAESGKCDATNFEPLP